MSRGTMASTFDQILAQGIRAGKIPARSSSARTWFRNRARGVETTAQKIIQKERAKQRSSVEPGRMYLFSYDPKHKKTLPYYDRFPLIFMIDAAPNGFLGINLHYLPFRQRAILMDALYSLVNNRKFDDTTKLKLSYDLLKNASKYKYFKPCFKRYLGSHVRSRFIEIAPAEWDVALFLPIQRFEKATTSQVWNQSLQTA
jgi:hypothetical protein